MNISDIVKRYLVNELGLDENIDEKASLFSEKLLDSMDIVGLLSFLESEFKVKFNPFDVGIEQFDSIEKITNTIKNLYVQ